MGSRENFFTRRFRNRGQYPNAHIDRPSRLKATWSLSFTREIRKTEAAVQQLRENDELTLKHVDLGCEI